MLESFHFVHFFTYYTVNFCHLRLINSQKPFFVHTQEVFFDSILLHIVFILMSSFNLLNINTSSLLITKYIFLF